VKIKTRCEVEVYEENDEEINVGESKQFQVFSHWNVGGYVILKIGETRYTISASELKKAIDKCRNDF
jgi:hypothetical protein